MGFRIGFKFNFGILQNSMAFRFKRKIKEKGRKKEEKETKETKIRIKLEHINGIQNYIDLKQLFDLIQNSVAFSWV